MKYRSISSWLLIALALGAANLLSDSLFAQEANPKPAQKSADGKAETPAAPAAQPANDFPDLSIPAGADVATLQQLVLKAKKAKPGSPVQYKAQQTAIRDGSTKLLQMIKKEDPAYKQAEMDTILSSVALLTFFNEKDQASLIQQVTDFLKSRKKLSMQDVQTGMLAAGMIELRPEKKPAYEIYVLLDELLKEDEREEMQSLRINLQAAARRLSLLGNKLDFATETMDGKSIKIDDFAGKFVIVDIFATWCQPCIEEMALIRTHYDKYKDKGLVVIGISLDEDREKLEAFLAEKKLPWPVVHDNATDPLERLQLKFGVSSLPTVLLLNKEGTVISLEARNAELTRLMQMLFEAPTLAAPQAAKTDETAKTQDTTKTEEAKQ